MCLVPVRQQHEQVPGRTQDARGVESSGGREGSHIPYADRERQLAYLRAYKANGNRPPDWLPDPGGWKQPKPRRETSSPLGSRESAGGIAASRRASGAEGRWTLGNEDEWAEWEDELEDERDETTLAAATSLPPKAPRHPKRSGWLRWLIGGAAVMGLFGYGLYAGWREVCAHPEEIARLSAGKPTRGEQSDKSGNPSQEIHRTAHPLAPPVYPMQPPAPPIPPWR